MIGVPVLVIGLLLVVALLKPDDATETTSPAAPATDPFAPNTDPAPSVRPPHKPVPESRPADASTPVAASASEAERAVLMLGSGDNRSSAFFASSNGRIYIYTTAHSVTSADITFRTFRGQRLTVNSDPEVVTGRIGHDMVRFPFNGRIDACLDFASREEIEEKPRVLALGDSGGADILSTLPGTIQGVGPDKIEVDCEFIPGNSGGPIVTESGKVVGVVSFLTADSSIWAKDTQHEVRRFAWIPSPDLQWTSLSLGELVNESRTIDDLWCSQLVLLAICHVTPLADGASWSPDVTVDDRLLLDQIFTNASEHPLVKGLFETDQSVIDNHPSGGSELEAVRTFARFFEYCSDLADDQLRQADKTIVSSFNRKRLEELEPSYKESLNKFRRLAGAFNRQHQLGRSLSSFE